MSNFYNVPNTESYIYIDSNVVDIGAAINAADAALGAGMGTIEVAPGNYAVHTQIILSSNRVLKLGLGSYSPDFDDIFCFFRNNTVIEGDGWNTIIYESSYGPSNQANIIFCGFDDYTTGSQTINTNITIRNLQIHGGTGTSGDGARASVFTGCCSEVVIDNIYFNTTHPIGVALGQSNSFGKHSTVGLVQNCFFFKVFAVSLAAVNSTDFQFLGNSFIGSAAITDSAYIDLEVNDDNDWMRNFVISDNYIDCSTADMLGTRFGIDLITSGGPLPGPGIISNNVFVGGSPAFGQNAMAMFIPSSENILITGNNIQYYNSTAILVDGGRNLVVSNNRMKFVGEPAVAVGVTHSQFINNVIDNAANDEPSGNSFGASFHEGSSADYNTYIGNYISSYVAPGGEVVFKGGISLFGANSIAQNNLIDGTLLTQTGTTGVLPTVLSANYTILKTDSVIFGNSTSATFNVFLPSATTTGSLDFALWENAGRILTFKNIGSANEILVIAAGTQTIEGKRAIVVLPGQCTVIQSDGANWKIVSNSNFVSGFVPTTQANIAEYRLNDTSAIPFLNCVTPQDGNYIVYAYWRVTTATTNLGITLTYTDQAGAQTVTLLSSATPQTVGSNVCIPVYINAATGTNITITATAGTANQVYLSGTVMSFNGSLAQGPLNIANCVCWLRSDLGVSTSGSRVTAWADQTGNGNGAFDPAALGPTLQSSGTALGLPALVFNLSNVLGWNLILNGPKTIIMVLKENISPTTVNSFLYYELVTDNVSGSTNYLLQVSVSFAITPYGGIFLTGDDLTSTPSARLVYGGTSAQLPLTPHVIINTYNGAGAGVAANFTASIDGINQAITASSQTATATSGSVSSIGAGILPGPTASSGIQDELYEMIVYDKVLSPAELTVVTNYITTRYGLAY